MKAVLRCILFILFLLPLIAIGQPRFSVSSDVSIMHNFDGRQPFTVPGQSIGVQWHPEVFEADDPHTRDLFRGFVDAARR